MLGMDSSIWYFHMNDVPADIPRLEQQDKDRVFPGDWRLRRWQEFAEHSNPKGGKSFSHSNSSTPTYYAMGSWICDY